MPIEQHRFVPIDPHPGTTATPHPISVTGLSSQQIMALPEVRALLSSIDASLWLPEHIKRQCLIRAIREVQWKDHLILSLYVRLHSSDEPIFWHHHYDDLICGCIKNAGLVLMQKDSQQCIYILGKR